jgi:hypothetical protein
MEFNLSHNDAKAKGQYQLNVPEGQSIAYEEPLYNWLFRETSKAMESTKWPRQFIGRYYRSKSNNGFLEEVVPAPEYYKISIRGMTQKFHGMLCNIKSIKNTCKEISENFEQGKGVSYFNDQPRLKFDMELYNLRSDISSYLFLVRSLLDQFAIILQSFTGPKSQMFSSFSDLMKKIKTESKVIEFDQAFCDYLKNNLDWYWKLKDFRDFIAHHGFITLGLKKQEDGTVKIFLQNRINLIELIDEFQNEIEITLQFFDKHFSQYINEKAKIFAQPNV